MMRTAPGRPWLLALLVLALPACRDPDEGKRVRAPEGVREGLQAASIPEVQRGEVAEGSRVQLREVVVTAVHARGKGTVYVSDPGASEYGGLAIFAPEVAGGAVRDLAPGDIIDVTGTVVEHRPKNARSSVTQLALPPGRPEPGRRKEPPLITRHGQGEVPGPVLVDPVRLAASPEEAEKYEGMLVRMVDVGVVEASRGEEGRARIIVTGPLELGSQLAALDGLQVGQCLAAATGILDDFHGYRLLPRSADDLVAGGQNCPVEALDVCQNDADDDHDGAVDCADADCSSAAHCSRRIADLHAGEVEMGGGVRLPRVVVTAVDWPSMLWVRDGDGPSDGIVLYDRNLRGSLGEGADLAEGDVLDVSGVLVEHRGLLEIAQVRLAVLERGGPAPAPLAVEVAQLAEAGALERHESALIELRNVAAEARGEEGLVLTLGGDAVLAVRNDIGGDAVPSAAACFERLVGVVTEYDDDRQPGTQYRVLPRRAADLAASTSACTRPAGEPPAARSR